MKKGEGKPLVVGLLDPWDVTDERGWRIEGWGRI